MLCSSWFGRGRSRSSFTCRRKKRVGKNVRAAQALGGSCRALRSALADLLRDTHGITAGFQLGPVGRTTEVGGVVVDPLAVCFVKIWTLVGLKDLARIFGEGTEPMDWRIVETTTGELIQEIQGCHTISAGTGGKALIIAKADRTGTMIACGVLSFTQRQDPQYARTAHEHLKIAKKHRGMQRTGFTVVYDPRAPDRCQLVPSNSEAHHSILYKGSARGHWFVDTPYAWNARTWIAAVPPCFFLAVHAVTCSDRAVYMARPLVQRIGSCLGCGLPVATRRCGRCLWASYCSRSCQVGHWKIHSPDCSKKLGTQ